MAIMGVTVQHYITASGLKMFTYAFERLGFTPPTVWTANGLNAEEKNRRDIVIYASSELSWMKLEISKIIGMKATWEKSLASGDLSDDQKSDIRAAIEGSKESIDNLLRLQLIRWYKRKSYRNIYNSVMKSMGFGLVATPTMQNPDRLLISVRIGSKLLSYSMRANQVESLMDRMVDFGDAYSTDELKSLSKIVGISNETNEGAFDSSLSEIVPR
jgi:hypothetical protein